MGHTRRRLRTGLLFLLMSVFMLLQPSSRELGARALSGENIDWVGPTYLPMIVYNHPVSPFAAESNIPVTGVMADRAQELGVEWMRLHRISWMEIQAAETSGYDWSGLVDFDRLARRRVPAMSVPDRSRESVVRAGPIRSDPLDARRALTLSGLSRSWTLGRNGYRGHIGALSE